MPRVLNLTGRRFGRLLVLGQVQKQKGQKPKSTCRCDCGTEINIINVYLTSGDTKSCGCYRREFSGAKSRTHGMSNTSIYAIWSCMIGRTTNPKQQDWKYYGGRGITVCERWKRFENFYADMGDRPTGMTLDRRDNQLGYDKSNCRWATKHEQVNNRRNNVLVEYRGQVLTVAEAARCVGMGYDKLHQRVTSGKSGINIPGMKALNTERRK